MKTRTPPRQKPLLRGRGSALVVSLAFVVILTILILAYFNVVTVDRLATKNYTQGLKAEEMAHGAADFVVGQLRAEMAASSSALRVGGHPIFTNLGSTNILPEALGGNGQLLIKASGTNGLFSGAVAHSTSVSSATPSANQRRIPPGRWEWPLLGPTTAAPLWFLIAANGITNVPTAEVTGRFAVTVYDLGSLVNINVAGAPSSLSSAQREALGGTLAGISLDSLGWNASATDALLTGFRNRTSALSAAAYTNYVLNVAATNGHLRVAPGDDTFLSRQDFLAYARLHGLTNAATNFTTFARTINSPAWGPMTNAGTVSVQKITRNTIPAWNPFSGGTTSTATVDANYKNHAYAGNATNRAILSQRVTGNFTRLNDIPAIVGEPLVITRFPLDRLAWLSKNGPSAIALARFGNATNAAAKIKAAFGLVWDSGNRLWVYTSPDAGHGGGNYASGNSDGPASTGKAASAIKTLDIVASENREPDFFELLQAGILRGSLGQHSSIINPVSAPQPGEVTPEGHLFQIGANIIDQYDEDDFPMLIRAYMPVVMDGSKHAWDVDTTTGFVLGSGSEALTPHDFAGIENIPYLMALRTRAYRPQVGNSADGGRRFGEGILMPQFWNPHRNATSPSSDRPSSFRIIQTFGEIRMVFMGQKDSGGGFAYAGYVTSPPSEWPSNSLPAAAQPMIQFASSRTFDQPGLLDPADVLATSRPENIQTAFVQDQHTRADVNGNGFVGFWLGRAPAKGAEVVAMLPIDAPSDNTPIDYEVWATLTTGSSSNRTDSPVQQYIKSVATPEKFNATPLPASDRFWKGDTALAASSRRYPVFELQYEDGGVWKTYQRFDGVIRGGGADHKWDTYWPSPSGTSGGQAAESFSSESHAAMYARPDPRGSRLGLVRIYDPTALYSGTWNGNPHSYRNTPISGALGVTGRPNGEANVSFNGTPILGNQGGATFSATFDPSNDGTRWVSHPFTQWQENLSTGQHFNDNDQILRRGDADLAHGIDLLASSTLDRPILLNRPFQTPGDLGYVHRDLPFKTLDVFSADSADAALLDLFSIREEPRIAADKISLNGRNVLVLAQVLEGTRVDEITSSGLTLANAQSIAQALTNRVATSPLVGTWELPDFLASSGYRSATSGRLAYQKAQAESVARRLATLADTRCWNLLVDIVAQAGKYSAAELAKPTPDPAAFLVEGERRYWLHLSIDRFTGEVVSQEWEPVLE